MLYEYFCSGCNTLREIEKKEAERERLEFCLNCDVQMDRQISKHIGFKNEKTESNEAFFSHALGQVVRNEKHQRELARERGLVEVGNEKSALNSQAPQYKSYDLSDSDYHDVMGVGEI